MIHGRSRRRPPGETAACRAQVAFCWATYIDAVGAIFMCECHVKFSRKVRLQ